MSDEKTKPASQFASLTNGPTRMRFIAKDGTILVVEPRQTVVFDVSKAPWTYMPETEEN